jgi:hypothetical protein
LSYYFRGRWFWANGPVAWPWLQKFGLKLPPMPESLAQGHEGPPKPHTGLNVVEAGDCSKDERRNVA